MKFPRMIGVYARPYTSRRARASLRARSSSSAFAFVVVVAPAPSDRCDFPPPLRRAAPAGGSGGASSSASPGTCPRTTYPATAMRPTRRSRSRHAPYSGPIVKLVAARCTRRPAMPTHDGLDRRRRPAARGSLPGRRGQRLPRRRRLEILLHHIHARQHDEDQLHKHERQHTTLPTPRRGTSSRRRRRWRSRRFESNPRALADAAVRRRRRIAEP